MVMTLFQVIFLHCCQREGGGSQWPVVGHGHPLELQQCVGGGAAQGESMC